MISGDEVWIARRSPHAKIMPDLLECVGGSQEQGELALDTIIREMKEEAGLSLRSNRFDFKGVIFVDGWWYNLYFVELENREEPKNVEPTKRTMWWRLRPEHLTMHECSPALGALLSILMQELRMDRKHTDHGRGDANGPFDSGCPCTKTDEQQRCADTGCGFCGCGEYDPSCA